MLQVRLLSGVPYPNVAQLGSAPRLGRGGRTFKSCHSDHFGDLRIIAKMHCIKFGATLVVVVVQELPLMESKPVKVLGRPAKTDAPFGG